MAVKLVIPAQPSHFLLLDYELTQNNIEMLVKGSRVDLEQFLRNCAMAFTLMVDGRVEAIAGVAANGYAWTLLAKTAGPHLNFIRKQVLVRIDILEEVHTFNQVDDVNAHRWCELLGFRFAEEFKNPEDGLSYYRYIRRPHRGNGPA